MDSKAFCYWLNGFMELRDSDDHGLTERQVDIIKDHLKLIFDKKTPVRATFPDYNSMDTFLSSKVTC
jgi:hypothetical protein